MRKRTWIIIALTIAAALLVWITSRRGRSSVRTPDTAPAADIASPGTSSGTRPRRAPTPGLRGDAVPPPWAARPAAEPPIVDAITVDKTEACDGEEVLVTITAHTAGGEDDLFLHGSIADRPGLTVPVVVARGPDGLMAPQQAVIHGRGGSWPTVLEIPRVKIKDCFNEYRALIASRSRANTVDELDFSVEIATGGYAAPFEPVAFRWSFGDGTSEETAAPLVTHSYGDRAQDRLYSDFVVGVEAVDRAGKVVRGRITVALRNDAFERLVREGVVLLLAAPTPRFAVADPQGAIRQRVRIWHHRAGNVALDRVTIAGVDHDPGAVLGIDSVPPDGVWVDLVLEAQEAAQGNREYQLHGTTSDGLPATGTFTIVLQPIEDPPLEFDHGPTPVADDDAPPPPRSGRITTPLDPKPGAD